MIAVRFTDHATPCVACHRDGRFSYWLESIGVWVENDTTVPDEVLASLPDDERNRVMRKMTEAGVM